jgi:phage gpG-like protein
MKKLINSLSPDKFQKEVNKAIKKYVEKVVSDAKTYAPTSYYREEKGQLNSYPIDLSSAISATVTDTGASIDVNTELAAYVEFGTGKFAERLLGTYPKEFQDLAWEYYKTGKGKIVGNPYLIPAIVENEDIIDKELQKFFDKL